VAYTIEYGVECDVQSALNLIYLLGYNSPGQFTVFGQSNEKYHVRSGNDQIVPRLADLLGSQIITGQALVALRRNPDGTYTLTFQISDQFTDVTADHVVLALPFSILKNSVDLTQAGCSELKMIRNPGTRDGFQLQAQRPVRLPPVECAPLQRGDLLRSRLSSELGRHARPARGRSASSLITPAARSSIPLATALPRSTRNCSLPRSSRCCRA
jgi:Flavin containing amine oxidoreductase